MTMRETARLLEELRGFLSLTDMPEDQVPIVVGAAAGIMLALARD